MLRCKTSSRRVFGRIGLFFVISAMFLTITAAGANAAGFSFMDSVKEFFGLAPITQTASSATTHALSVLRAGSGGGQVTSNPAGIDCPGTCDASFSSGQVVTLSAAPDSSSTFAGWSGACSGTSSTCDVTMDAAKSVTAQFNPREYTLSVALSGTGGGTVSSGDGQISCGSACSASYSHGTVVSLTAVPSADSTFVSWTGEPCAGLPENCDVTMSQARSVTATFAHRDFVVTDPGTALSGTYHDVSFAPGACVTAFLATDVTITGAMTVPSCASLETNGHRVLGSGSFALSNGGALYISDAYGITTPFSTVSCPVGADCGSIQTSSRSFSSEADYIYNGATDQIVGNALPSTVRNLHVVSPPSALTDTRVDGYSPQVVTGTLQITGSSSSSKKEFKGHVTLLKRPAVPCTEIDTYHHVVIDQFAKLTLGCDVTVTGDWSMSSSGSLAGDFAVTFNGSSPGEQHITGDTAFYKLQAGFIYATSPPPADLRVHGTITISNKVVLFGGQSDMLSISGQDNGTGTGTNDPWSMCAIGERDIQFVSVSDSNATCSGSPVVATDSIDGGGNTNWLFGNTVTVVKDGTGGGTVTSQPAGIDCGTTCSAVFSEGTMVTLTAVPNSNSQLGPWGGDCAGQPPAVCQLSGVLPIVPRNVLKTFFLDTTAPTVTIESTSPNPTTSSSSVTFHADEDGDFSVMVGGDDCDDTDGDIIADGVYSAPGSLTRSIPEHSLMRGTNTIRVCLQDRAGNTASASSSVQVQSCVAPDNGTGTVDLPAECRYLGGPIRISNGLPPGTELLSTGSLDSFTDVVRTPGGTLGGERVSSSAAMRLAMHGTGALSTFRKNLTINLRTHQQESASRTSGAAVQSFDTSMFAMEGDITGDPDFDLLRITAGSSFGLPSPGHTTLTRVPGTSSFSVDSYLDITYRLDYVCKPGGSCSGSSGSTTGTIRLSAVSGPRQSTSCSVADNGTGSVDLPAQCPSSGWPLSMSTSVAPVSTIVSDWTIDDFVVSSRVPGGSLGGERSYAACHFSLDLHGTSSLSSYMRSLSIPNGECVMDSAPRLSGQPVQSFDTDMFRVYGQLTGDPDFDLLRVSCGSSFGLPSPGHTTLRLSSGLWSVSGSTVLGCTVEYAGKPGGRLSGRSGSTTGTIRMQQGLPDNALTVTKGGNGGGTVTSSPAGIDCGSQCSAEFQSGSVVTLTAAPSSGSSFAGWTGACTGTGACDVTMDRARSVTAMFSSLDYVVSSSGALPSGTYRDVTFSGCFVAVMSGDITITGTMTVASCQTLDTNGFIVFGGGAFVLGDGGALYISDPNGVTKRNSATCPSGTQCGSIQTFSRSFSSAGDYTYNGFTNQHVGDGLPETVHNLVVLSPPSATTDTRLDGYSPQVVTGKLTVSGVNGPGKKEYVGHVTLLKRPTANSPCASDSFHDVEILAGGKMTLGCDITVSGDWTMATGGDLDGDYSVTLDGDDQTVSGDTSFYNFRKLSPGQTLIFPPLSRITVTNDLTLHGAPGSLLTIGGGGTSGSHWEMCALGTRSVDFVSVSNSDASCSGPPITATNSIDGGNNINWNFFVPTPTATNTNTPTSTPTSTATNTNTPTPTPTCGASIPVSMPNLHSSTNGVVVVPVTTGDVSSSGVLSTDITVTFDPAVLSPPVGPTFGVSLGPVANSNGGGRVLDAFSPSPGMLRVSIYGTQPMVGGGDLVYLTFNVVGAPGTSSLLSFSLFRYNETTPCTSATNGSVTVTGTISGTVIYGNPITGPNPRPVPNVLVGAYGSSLISSLTDSLGRYFLTGFGAGSYNVIPSKFGGVNNAISSFDAARVSQYVTGRITFTPAQIFVADVSGTTGVTSFDAALIARFVAALGPPQGSTGTWQFGPSSRSHSVVYSHITGEDYFAHLMGEVSGNWGDPSSFRPAFGAERSISVDAANLMAPSSGEVIVPIKVRGIANKEVISYQFTLRYDPKVIQPQADPVDLEGSVSRGLTAVANPSEPGLLRVVVYGASPIDSNGLLLNLKFTAVGGPDAVSPLTWENVIFNEGDYRTFSTNGMVELSASVPNQTELTD